ncbi:MAG: caspase family protein, partial [Thermotogae bacterium]|nr:caspase family protein [Thermotogota bacterium]
MPEPGVGDFIRVFKEWAGSARAEDTLMFYYAGHGMSKEGKFCFIPVDADPEDEYTWVSFNRLKDYIEKYAPSDVKVVWLIDACYSGSMVKGRPLRAIRVEKEALSAGANQVIITSSSENEISREMPDGSGGVFTVTLVEGFKGAADEDGDGWIESGELYRYVEKKVEQLSMGQQHPMMRGQGSIKIVANISGKLKELKYRLYDARDAGKITDLALKNTKAVMEGKKCKGEGYQVLKKAIDDYVSGKTTFEMLLFVVKAYGEKMSCAGVEVEEKPAPRVEEYTPQGTAFLKLKPANDLAKGAKVYIDGKYAGKIEGDQFNLEISAGKHKVLVTNEKIDDIEFEFEIGKYE